MLSRYGKVATDVVFIGAVYLLPVVLFDNRLNLGYRFRRRMRGSRRIRGCRGIGCMRRQRLRRRIWCQRGIGCRCWVRRCRRIRGMSWQRFRCRMGCQSWVECSRGVRRIRGQRFQRGVRGCRWTRWCCRRFGCAGQERGHGCQQQSRGDCQAENYRSGERYGQGGTPLWQRCWLLTTSHRDLSKPQGGKSCPHLGHGLAFGRLPVTVVSQRLSITIRCKTQTTFSGFESKSC